MELEKPRSTHWPQAILEVAAIPHDPEPLPGFQKVLRSEETEGWMITVSDGISTDRQCRVLQKSSRLILAWCYKKTIREVREETIHASSLPRGN